MGTHTTGTTPDRALVSAYSCQQALRDRLPRTRAQRSADTRSPRTATSRLEASLDERPYCLQRCLKDAAHNPRRETVLYLAYGSNLSSEKFREDRGIKPLSQINVQVPSLRLTFDLSGIPYLEPCFANTAKIDPHDDDDSTSHNSNEKASLLSSKRRKGGYLDGWRKGLVGVVYEITPEDYAHLVATEGGGASYQDILVDCHPFVSSNPEDLVPQHPTLPPFKAHALFSPAVPDGEPPKHGGHLQRPRADYAQASARYLKLITDGAEEVALPYEYQDYLLSLQPYTITTAKQRVGQVVFLAIWLPIVLAVFAFGKLFVDENGKLPKWMREFTGAILKAVWASYDGFFEPIFGDGERTIDQDGDDGIDESSGSKSRRGRTTKRQRNQDSHGDVEKGVR